MSVLMRLIAAAAGIATVLLVTLSTLQKPTAPPRVTSPREVVMAFEKLAFDERNPKQAILEYVSPDFIDHSPNMDGTRDGAIRHLDKLDWSTAAPQREIQRIIADQDIVAIHHRLTRKPGDPSIAVVDIFRVKDGMIVEHWDVLQPVPADTVNPAPMF
ncbi:MAG: nuclear transport factor 2 family protein [Steroidobacteraceae bacterium]